MRSLAIMKRKLSIKQKRSRKFQFENDQRLWRILRNGNPVALNRLFIKYYSDLYFYGLKLVGNNNRVSDAIQDVFANIWETRKGTSEVNHVRAYLFVALRNNLLRVNPKDILNSNDYDVCQNSDFCFDISPEDIYIDNELKLGKTRIIEELLSGLSPKQREIIYLKFYSNYSNIEISSILSIKPQSVANLLTRTINKLRKKKP